MSARIDRFPLFPLDLVLLPGEIVPLHIFEERYKTMIGRCLDEDAEFGIVWLGRGGLREIGCSAEVSEVVERFDDGRLNILVAGTTPFRLIRRIDDMPYPAGEIELLPAGDAAADELVGEARAAYADLVERVTDERPGDDELAGLDAYAMAATVELDLTAKQELLELPSEDERLRRIDTLLRRALRRLEEVERVSELARTNGKAR